MPKDRLKRDYDNVENLDDLIQAREERDSASADSVDAMEDIETAGLPVEAVDELTFPHPRHHPEDDRLGLNVNLMDTPDNKDIGFDWQDSAEEMLPTDPEPNEGMGLDSEIEALAHVDPADLTAPSTPEEETEQQSGPGGGEPSPPLYPVQMDSAMDTDSDEEDFSVEDKFGGDVDRETALLEFEEMKEVTEKESGTGD